MADKFQQYSEVLSALVAEMAACAPPAWTAGRLSIQCDGRRIDYALKNDSQPGTAVLSDELRRLAEALYTRMAQQGETWRQATVTYTRIGNDVNFTTSFDYEGKAPQSASATAAPAPAPARGLGGWTKKLCVGLGLGLGLSGVALAQDPEALVSAFIADYEAWNNKAIARGTDMPSIEEAEADYAKLIAKYCPPGFRSQPVAFGTHAQHSPQLEKIVSVDIGGDKALVRTLYARTKPILLQHRYEYRLEKKMGRWYLSSMQYVDDDGKKYEGL